MAFMLVNENDSLKQNDYAKQLSTMWFGIKYIVVYFGLYNGLVLKLEHSILMDVNVSCLWQVEDCKTRSIQYDGTLERGTLMVCG